MAPKKLRILAELRPAAEGFAGIPQETRLVFSSLLENPALETVGLLNSQNRTLRRALHLRNLQKLHPHLKTDILAKFIISTKFTHSLKLTRFLNRKLKIPLDDLTVLFKTLFGISYSTDRFDAKLFENFIWERFFSASLVLDEFDKIVDADYRTLQPNWEAMQRAGRFFFGHPVFPKIDTAGFDIFLSQFPFPAKISASTRTVIRFHDAISVFMPHTVPAAFARKALVNPLRLHAKNATFVCTSAASRADLLKLYPEAERRTHVLHNMIADVYFEENAPVERLIDLAVRHLDPQTSPKFTRLRERDYFYRTLSQPPGFKYILMVSTLEPRKNHIRLIQAWERLRGLHNQEIKLIFVGALGWGAADLLKDMQPWQERGQLLHLSGVPAPSLRLLYNGAACVVCPSTAEGFDQSGIEAMMCGGVTAASDIPVHREVYGDATTYFNAYSVEAQAEAILSLIADTDEAQGRREAQRRAGLAHAEKYRQKHIKRQWHALFETIVHEK